MVDLGGLTARLTGSFTGVSGQVMQVVNYLVYSVIIFAFMFGAYIFVQYKYTTPIIKVEKGGFSKKKWERARVVRERGIEKWKLLKARRTIKPVPLEYIEKNSVTLLQTSSDTFTPLREEQELVDKEGEKVIIRRLIPIEEDNKYWYQLQEKQTALEYQPDDLAKKQMFITMGTIIFCLILCGFTVWLSLKSGQDVAAALKSIKDTPLLHQVAQRVAPK